MEMGSLKGWHPGMIETRLADLSASSYDAKARTVDTVISRGVPVKRFYGTETLRIHPKSVITERLDSPGIPVLDAHQQTSISNVLGRVSKVWFRGGAFWGTLSFADTPNGRMAEGMVARREIGGVSAGYRVEEWEITNADGDVVDPDNERMRMDEDYKFEAVRWEILECSLAPVPADATASIRSLGEVAWPAESVLSGRLIEAARMRMLARSRMSLRERFSIETLNSN
jgi:hypothetical protein